MKARIVALSLGAVVAGQLMGGCTVEEGAQDEGNFTSAEATLLTFEFDGELVTTQTWDLEQTVQDQLLYTIGQLNGNRSVGRLDTTTVTILSSDRLEDDSTHVKYHAVMPVGWGKKTDLPKEYTFRLPKLVDFGGLQKFSDRYKTSCVDSGAHDVSPGNLWYYYRPNRSGCSIDAADIATFKATVTKSAENTEGKYPEYHQVWDDEELRAVAIFGKYEDGATTSSDSGISAYGRFVATLRSTFSGAKVTPADVPTTPGVSHPDVTVEHTLSDGRKVSITALLVDNVSAAPESFFQRYEALSTESDLIFYNGHAGLGQNVRALAQRGEFRAGKYQIFFMNGCDTFAYVDGSLAKTRSTINPDDPTGTKYLDMVTNVMPSFFHSMPAASMALIDGLMAQSKPRTYQEIFEDIDSAEVVVVTGEEDNVFSPGGVEEPWELNESGAVERGEMVEFDAGKLPAGSYVIALHEDQASPGGDADLYVGLDREPTLTAWDFRPWLGGSNEEVRLELTKPTNVHLMVHGYENASQETAAFKISGRPATE